MTRRRWMAFCFVLGSTCFFIGPFPGYANLVGDSADAITFFVGSAPVHGRRRPPELACLAGASYPRRRARGLVGCCDSVSRHAVLQRHDLSSHAHRHDEPRVQQARVAARCFWVCLLLGFGRDRLSGLGASRMAAGASGRGMVAAGRQPAGVHLLRYLGDRRVCRAIDGFDARSGRCELEHGAWCRVFFGLRARQLAYRRVGEDAETAPRAGARSRARPVASDLMLEGDGHGRQRESGLRTASIRVEHHWGEPFLRDRVPGCPADSVGG